MGVKPRVDMPVVRIFMVVMVVMRPGVIHFGFGKVAGVCAFGVQKGDRPGRRRCLQRAIKPGRHFRPDPEDDIGLSQGRALGWAELKVMGIGALVQEHPGRSEFAHHRCDQRLHDRHVGDDARHLGAGGRGGKREKKDKTAHGNSLLASGIAALYVIS